MPHQTTRRAFVTSLPAIAAVSTVASAQGNGQKGDTDPHPEWMNQWRIARAHWIELAEMPDNGNWDDPRSIECNAIQAEMERRLSTVPATTIAGAIACLSWLEEEISPSEWLYKGHREALLNALAALRGVEARAMQVDNARHPKEA